MTVIGKRVWAKRVLDEVQVGSFVLAGSCRDMNPLFLVLGVGDVDGVAVGDKVVCRKYAGQAVGDEEYIFNEEDVLCVVYD
jgi:co-chaperonin GroES (HSP10)